MGDLDPKVEAAREASGQNKTLQRVRVKKNRHRRRDLMRRVSHFIPDLVLLIGLSVSLLLLLNPFPLLATPTGAGRVLGRIAMAEIEGVAVVPLAGLLLFLSVLVAGLYRLHQRILFRQAWWKTTCPACSSPDLRRTPRRARERLMGKLGIPVRRYICAECHWTGARIDQTRIP